MAPAQDSLTGRPLDGAGAAESTKKMSDLHAIFLRVLAVVGAEIKFPIKQLHCDDGKDEMEQHVDDEDVEHVLQRIDNAIEHGFQFRYALDRLQRAQNAQHAQRFDRAQILTRRAPPVTRSTEHNRNRSENKPKLKKKKKTKIKYMWANKQLGYESKKIKNNKHTKKYRQEIHSARSDHEK